MDYRPKILAPGSAAPGSPLSGSARHPVAALPSRATPQPTARTSRSWIALAGIGMLVLLPRLADVGCGFAAPGRIVVMQNGEFHCLWQVGAQGYRFNVDGKGRIADPVKGLCLPERQAVQTIADELNRRLPREYAECVDRRRDNPLQFRAQALASS